MCTISQMEHKNHCILPPPENCELLGQKKSVKPSGMTDFCICLWMLSTEAATGQTGHLKAATSYHLHHLASLLKLFHKAVYIGQCCT